MGKYLKGGYRWWGHLLRENWEIGKWGSYQLPATCHFIFNWKPLWSLLPFDIQAFLCEGWYK